MKQLKMCCQAIMTPQSEMLTDPILTLLCRYCGNIEPATDDYYVLKNDNDKVDKINKPLDLAFNPIFDKKKYDCSCGMKYVTVYCVDSSKNTYIFICKCGQIYNSIPFV